MTDWKSIAQQYQRELADLSDKFNGTPCANIRHKQELEELRESSFNAGLERAAEIADERASQYARSANRHEGAELGCVYTDKTGVAASIARNIRNLKKTNAA